MKVSDYQRYARNKKKITTEAKSSKCIFNDISNKYICISDHINNPINRDINKAIENMKKSIINSYFEIDVTPQKLALPLYKINFNKNIKRISELKSTKLFKISNAYCKQFKFSRIGRSYET
jgi:hypothetical protein